MIEPTVFCLGFSFGEQLSKCAQQFLEVSCLTSHTQILWRGGGGGIRLRAVISRNLGVNSTFYSIPSVTSKDHGRDSHIGSLEHIWNWRRCRSPCHRQLTTGERQIVPFSIHLREKPEGQCTETQRTERSPAPDVLARLGYAIQLFNWTLIYRLLQSYFVNMANIYN